MATKIRTLKQSGIVFYPQTVDKAVYVADKNKTLDKVIADLEARDVTVDTVLSATSENPLANKAVKTALDLKLDTTAFNNKIGVAGGIAPLDANSKVPAVHLPGYVDDVLELLKFIKATPDSIGLYYNEITKKIEEYNSVMPGDFVLINSNDPEKGKIYVNLSDNKTYRWSGSAMVVISETIALGETASTAYAGNKGKANADSIRELIGRIGTAEDNMSSHYTELEGIRVTANANRATIAAHAVEYTALNNSLTVEKAKTVTLQSKMGTAETNIGNLTTSVQSLNTGLGSTNTNVDAVKGRVATIEAAYITCQDTGGEVAYSIPAGIYQ